MRPKGRSTDSRLFATEQLGLSYLAAAARKSRLSVEIVDGYLEPDRYDTMLATIRNDDYAIIGYPVYPETVGRIARDIDTLRERGVKNLIVAGNHLATLCPEELLRAFPQFDAAIRGEGEITICALARALESGESLEAVLGLTIRRGNDFFSTPPRANIGDLDSMAFPTRDTLPLVLAAGNAPLLYSSRGCNARCTFCSVHNFFSASPNGAWRARSPANVVDEIEYLVGKFGVQDFAFADEQFMGHGNAGTERAVKIADEILARGLQVKWYIETRSSSVSFDVFAHLRAAGLRAVFMGLESGYEKTLKAFNKGIHVTQHFEAIEILKSLEILVSGGFIMFRPETTIEELVFNLSFLEQAECVEVTALLTRLRVYPGTALQRSLSARGRLRGPFYANDWDFDEPLVGACYEVVSDSADALSVMYNEFARIRRSGCLTYQECIAVQRAMNVAPIAILRSFMAEIALNNECTEDILKETRLKFVDAAENYVGLVRFVDVAARGNAVRPDNVSLLSPMSLC